MLNNLLIVCGQVATLFLMMSAGFLLRKKDKFPEKTSSDMTFILLYIVTPCLIFNSLQIERDSKMLGNIGVACLCTLFYFALSISISFLFYKKIKPDTRAVLRFGMIYPNSGFMGFPLIRAVLGEEALIYAAVFLVVFNLLQWTHGIIIMGGRSHASIKKVILNPCTLALIIGLVFFLTGIRLPWPVSNAFTHMANLNTPVAMLIIGAQMAGVDLLKTFRTIPLYVNGAMKLLVLPAITAAVLYPFNPLPLVYCTIVILSAAPSAGMTSMFAQRFNRDTASAAQSITLTTLLSILTLPVFAVIVKTLTRS